jgi:hypothetical protein
LISGAVTFGAPYIVSALVGGAFLSEGGDGSAFGPLLIPVVGPFVTIGTAQSEGLGTFFLALDGIAQTIGAGLFVAAFIAEEDYLERTGYAALKLQPPAVLVGPGSAALRWRF